MYSLRQATNNDHDFVFRLNVATMKDYVRQTWGRWNQAEQTARFSANFDPSSNRIIVADGEDVGVLRLEMRNTEIFLASILIMPAYQGRGLGTAVVKDVLIQGKRMGLPVKLQVLKVNPARRLYERLGFAVIGETETHYQMAYSENQVE